MELSSIPIIVIISYMVGEIYKVIFKNKESMYKLIPIVVSLTGGILGILIYLTNKEMILDANNIWVAMFIGIISGASATNANQIIKKLFCKWKGEQ